MTITYPEPRTAIAAPSGVPEDDWIEQCLAVDPDADARPTDPAALGHEPALEEEPATASGVLAGADVLDHADPADAWEQAWAVSLDDDYPTDGADGWTEI